ncbi:MAG: peptide chain release factor N(5)-glutamine methyltransferase [Thermodesulfobacteriaceae bacterium]|nr:peptide chain release factor N(5)-glutamine methyltransferase [Thermodesulfobacteriaceae bacterium]MDW8135990.1 peptide chain release factor N(5)-glutamine methyltransferase [Thermodesulfobacterium sp.]
MKVRVLLDLLKIELSKIEPPEYANWEALLIISHFLNLPPLKVYLYKEEFLERDLVEKIWSVLEGRKTGKPLPYLLGIVYFFGRPFYIEEGVLIPRAETEILISSFLEFNIREGPILELGTGSGVIGITLLLENPRLKILGVEISSKAIKLTQRNAQFHKVEKRLFLIKGDWFSPLKEGELFSAIISNPPYLSEKEWETLDLSVKNFEPKEALVAGKEGTEYQEELLRKAPLFLKKDGFLFFEMGYNQDQRIEFLLKKYRWNFKFYQDLRGYQRVVVAWKT